MAWTDASDVLALGRGVMPPSGLVSQHLETGESPHELHLFLEADRGSMFDGPGSGRPFKAYDFWRVTLAASELRLAPLLHHGTGAAARLPRARGKRVSVPVAREGIGFALLFEQAAREMAIADQRLWRVIGHYVGTALERLDLADLKAV